jgi:hypothetical protein
MGMWTIYTRTIPSLRRRMITLSSTVDAEVDLENLRAERKEVRWTANKLLSDLIFVCESITLHMPQRHVEEGADG